MAAQNLEASLLERVRHEAREEAVRTTQPISVEQLWEYTQKQRALEQSEKLAAEAQRTRLILFLLKHWKVLGVVSALAGGVGGAWQWSQDFAETRFNERRADEENEEKVQQALKNIETNSQSAVDLDRRVTSVEDGVKDNNKLVETVIKMQMQTNRRVRDAIKKNPAMIPRKNRKALGLKEDL